MKGKCFNESVVFNSTRILDNNIAIDGFSKEQYDESNTSQHLDPAEMIVGKEADDRDQDKKIAVEKNLVQNLSIIYRNGPINDTIFGHPVISHQVVGNEPTPERPIVDCDSGTNVRRYCGK